MRPFGVRWWLAGLALVLCARSALADGGPPAEAGAGEGSITQEAGPTDGSSAGEAASDEGGPVTMPIDGSLRVLDASSAADGSPSGTSGGGNGCSTTRFVRGGGVVADLGALVLAAGVLLRRRTKGRRERRPCQRPSASV